MEGNTAVIPEGILADIAPSILDYMKIQKPHSMTGRNLLEIL